MRVWEWTRKVITDQTGGLEAVPIGLERNPAAAVELGARNAPGVPLFLLRVGLRSGFGRTRAGLPVYRHENPSPHPILKEIYHCEVAGTRLEAANIHALRDKVQRQLDVIAPALQLPLCYFRSGRFDYALPVYEEGSRLICPVLTGPRLKADSLAELRDPVIRHLRVAGYLGEDEDPEVLVLRPSDLRLVPPAAVVRSLDHPGLWMPTVEGTAPDGPVIGLLVRPAELGVRERPRVGVEVDDSPPAAADVTALIRYIGHEMAVRGHLLNPWALYATDVRPEIWARTEELTDATPYRLCCHLEGGEFLEIAVRHTAAGELVGALKEHAISVFLGGDLDSLTASVGRYLVASGHLRHPEDLRAELTRERPPESLDPESIRTERQLDRAMQTTDREVTRT